MTSTSLPATAHAGATPAVHRVAIDGGSLCVFEWNAGLRGRAPSLLLLHATGFHARCWDAVLRRLAPRHVVAVDQRGHGRSDEGALQNWSQFGDDVAAVIDAFSLEGALGAGHSMGGHALVLGAASRPAAFERLLLIDPVIMPPEAYDGPDLHQLYEGGTHPTSRRRAHFDSVEQMVDRFRDRTPFAAFLPEVLRDYCEFGLLPDPAGEGFVLACRPGFEASVYLTSRSNAAIYDSVDAIDVPVHVLRAQSPKRPSEAMDFRNSPTWPELWRRFARGSEEHLADCTHFIPMEHPDIVVEALAAPPPTGTEQGA